MVDLGTCLDREYAKADAELDGAYRAALAGVRDTAQRNALVRAERAWIVFRDAEEALWYTFADGNHPSIEALPNKIVMTRTRAAFLRGMIGSDAVPPEPGMSTEPEASPPPKPIDEPRLVAAMKTDLRNLVTAEEAFFADSVAYTAHLELLGFHPTAGNTPPQITLSRDGWGAVIGNAWTPTRCAIYVGSTPMPPAIREGEPRCE